MSFHDLYPSYNLLTTLTENIYATLLILFCIAMFAGFVDSIAGGGGLVTLPTLLLTGIDPILALGTNKLQATMGELTSSINFIRQKQLNLQGIWLGVVLTMLASLAGSVAVSFLPKYLVMKLLPIFMLSITLYAIFSKRLRDTQIKAALISKIRFYVLCGIAIGFYNGFFGPGVGSIWIICFILLLGYTAKMASMHTKPLNLAANAVSLIYFLSIGKVYFLYGLTMGCGQVLGALIGSRCMIKNGEKLVRPVFITVCLCMTLKLFHSNYF